MVDGITSETDLFSAISTETIRILSCKMHNSTRSFRACISDSEINSLFAIENSPERSRVLLQKLRRRAGGGLRHDAVRLRFVTYSWPASRASAAAKTHCLLRKCILRCEHAMFAAILHLQNISIYFDIKEHVKMKPSSE